MEPMPNSRLVGSTTPRLYTEPLRELTPETSLGFAAIEFAEEILGVSLMPWQRYWLIHALELKPDGNFRFKTILTLLPRQCGKTELLSVLTTFLQFTDRAKLILGTAQSLDIAREAWLKAVTYAQSSPALIPEIADIRRANGEQCLTTRSGSRYRISATTKNAGRGLSVDLLIFDELRTHDTWDSWNALMPTTTARPNSLIVGISNAGDQTSVVLNTLRASALAGDDPSLGLFEWSAPDGCELDDEDAWVQSNPSLGYLFDESVLRSALATMTPAGFRTERLCQTVESLDGAIDIQSWNDAADPGTTLEAHRDKIVVGVDVSIDGTHTSLIAAARVGQRFRVEVIAAWNTPEEARRDLPGLLGKLKPMGVVWIPSGPGAVLGAEMRAVEAIELKGIEVAEACQSLSDLVSAGRIAHSGDPMLSTQVSQATKYNVGDGWRFARRGGVGNVDAVYALAAAIHVLRTHEFEKPLPKPMVV